ncbi:hypothetical protein QJQ45_011817 [Haematococcus lacustris]|nr:hypothetical protein QJQ45_011817 [Haematococcus lacustris]
MQRPLELCQWEGLEALPSSGKEYQQGYKRLEEEMAEVAVKRHGRVQQLVVALALLALAPGEVEEWMLCCVPAARCSAVNGQQPCESRLSKRRATRPADWKPPGGQVEQRLVRPAWSQQRDQTVRGLMWCPVVAPRTLPQAPSSSQAATQPAASEPGPSTHPQAKRRKRTNAEQGKVEQAAEPTQSTKGKGKAAKAKPAPQPGRWLDRDCNAALNMQRTGESKWRPLELCWWPEQGALPAKGMGTSGCETSHPSPSSSPLRHSSMCPVS